MPPVAVMAVNPGSMYNGNLVDGEASIRWSGVSASAAPPASTRVPTLASRAPPAGPATEDRGPLPAAARLAPALRAIAFTERPVAFPSTAFEVSHIAGGAAT